MDTKEKEFQSKTFETSNRGEAAYLRAKHIPVSATPNPHRINRAKFIAPGTPDTFQAVREFKTNACIAVQDFLDALESVTDEMKAVVRSRTGSQH